jgi:hypothetical protein
MLFITQWYTESWHENIAMATALILDGLVIMQETRESIKGGFHLRPRAHFINPIAMFIGLLTTFCVYIQWKAFGCYIRWYLRNTSTVAVGLGTRKPSLMQTYTSQPSTIFTPVIRFPELIGGGELAAVYRNRHLGLVAKVYPISECETFSKEVTLFPQSQCHFSTSSPSLL